MNVALVALKATAVAPVNPDPVSVTAVPAGPLAGVKEVICGAGVGSETVKVEALVPVPAEFVTLMDPVVAPEGTEVEICVSEATINEAADVPLNATLVVPVKLEPVTVTAVPAVPLVGEKELTWGIAGGWDTINAAELAPVPADVVTLMGPVVVPEGTVVLS